MNATQFLELIHNVDVLEKSGILQLKKVQENFPYFQIPHVLSARYEFLKDGVVPGHVIGAAAITSPDRIWLKTLVERPLPKKPQEDKSAGLLPESSPDRSEISRTGTLKQLGEDLKANKAKKESVSQEPNPEKAKPIRRKLPQDDLIETIKRKEKKEIVDVKKKEQMDMIRAFSKKEIKLATIREIEANQNTENLAAASTQINDKLLSESFARILAKQGKKQMAIEIYGKLLLKFPDKRAYFADLIEKLKD